MKHFFKFTFRWKIKSQRLSQAILENLVDNSLFLRTCVIFYIFIVKRYSVRSCETRKWRDPQNYFGFHGVVSPAIIFIPEELKNLARITDFSRLFAAIFLLQICNIEFLQHCRSIGIQFRSSEPSTQQESVGFISRITNFITSLNL